MRILYEACDGKVFTEEMDCYLYENSIIHNNLIDIDFYDSNNTLFRIDEHELFDDNVYFKSEKVIIHNESELHDFMWLVEECGWCEWDQITSPGKWVRYENDFADGEVG